MLCTFVLFYIAVMDFESWCKEPTKQAVLQWVCGCWIFLNGNIGSKTVYGCWCCQVEMSFSTLPQQIFTVSMELLAEAVVQEQLFVRPYVLISLPPRLPLAIRRFGCLMSTIVQRCEFKIKDICSYFTNKLLSMFVYIYYQPCYWHLLYSIVAESLFAELLRTHKNVQWFKRRPVFV